MSGEGSRSAAAYVRDARPDEYETIGLLMARAFAKDPLMNWMGSVSHPLSPPSRVSASIGNLAGLPKEIETLYYFHHSIILSTSIVGGKVMVVVVPEDGKERIVQGGLWLPPNTRIDTPGIILRSKQHRTMFGSWKRPGGWGFTGLKRAAFTYEPRMEQVQRESLKSRSMEFKTAWHLLDVATDPEEEGKGYCSMLMRQGLEKISGDAPVYMEATTPRSRDIYEHLGFEVTASPLFGRKQVTETGLPPVRGSNETATGFPIWSMVKMTTSLSNA